MLLGGDLHIPAQNLPGRTGQSSPNTSILASSTCVTDIELQQGRSATLPLHAIFATALVRF